MSHTSRAKNCKQFKNKKNQLLRIIIRLQTNCSWTFANTINFDDFINERNLDSIQKSKYELNKVKIRWFFLMIFYEFQYDSLWMNLFETSWRSWIFFKISTFFQIFGSFTEFRLILFYSITTVSSCICRWSSTYLAILNKNYKIVLMT